MKNSLSAAGVVLALIATTPARAELVQQFKDPTFSGAGWASHVLTLEQMRQGAQSSVDSKAAAERASLAAEAANTPMAKFMSLFTGQVYSQLATQLTNNLFCTKNCTSPDNEGSFNVSTTQQIYWKKEGSLVSLSVYTGKVSTDGTTFVKDNPTKPDQTIVVPISSFAF